MINYDIIKTELTLFLDCPVNDGLTTECCII